MFLTGTLLNAFTVVIGTTVGVLVGEPLSEPQRTSLTDVLGLFVVLIGVNLALRVFGDPALGPGDDLAVLGALIVGVICGHLLRLTERLDALGEWFQRRLSTPDRPSRVAEAFVTASLVFCVGPLTILGSIQNGLSGDVQLLAVKSLLDGVASMAFAAALGFGVYLAAVTVFVVQGTIALIAWLLGRGLDDASIAAISAAGGVVLMGTGLRLLAIRQIAVADMLPALLFAPLFVAIAAAVRSWLGG
jgi:uncharacterized membrane protein YqgA involved in biofilm formation